MAIVMRKRPYLLGLTGGIGSGKSTVAKMLEKLGATVVDADAVSRRLTASGGAAIPAIRTGFGADVIDSTGALNRSKMRDLVFTQPAAKQRLEAILHPLIQLEMQQQIAAATTRWVVLDLPLLAERTGFAGWRAALDAVWVIDCTEETQIKRVMEREANRSRMTRQQVQAVMANQATRQQRLAIADVVIGNEGLALSTLEHNVTEAFTKLQ